MDLTNLAIRILLDSPIRVDEKTLVYCYAHNKDNIYMMSGILERHGIQKIHILDNKKPMSGVEMGIDNKKLYEKDGFIVNMIPYNNDIIHTKIESNVVIEYAKLNGYNHIIGVTPPFHTLRAIMTLVSSSIDKGVKIKINSLAGITNNWSSKSITHQGKTCTTGNELISIELDRIRRYTQKGDIKEISEILEYFTLY